MLTRLEEFLARARPGRRGGAPTASACAELAPAAGLGAAFASRIERIA